MFQPDYLAFLAVIARIPWFCDLATTLSVTGGPLLGTRRDPVSGRRRSLPTPAALMPDSELPAFAPIQLRIELGRRAPSPRPVLGSGRSARRQPGLVEPMGPDRKSRIFDLSFHIFLQEIESGFPAASPDHFDFVRH